MSTEMKDENRQRIEHIWLRTSKFVPVLYRRGKGFRLLIRMPYANDNRSWLRNGQKYKPEWIPKLSRWVVPKAWFNTLVKRMLERYGKVYVIQPYREQEKCAPACWNAEGQECECSCMGEYHGTKGPNSNWLIISDTFATRWHDSELACRLIECNSEK